MYNFNQRLAFIFLLFFASVRVMAQPSAVFFEPFDNNNNGWSLFEQPYAKSKIVGGAMYMDATDEGIGFFNQMHLQIDPAKDFQIKTVFEVRSFRNGSFGLGWGADEEGNYQAFDFNHNGFYHAFIFKRKKVVPIHRPDILPTPLEEGRKYELIVKKTGGEISFELNGKAVTKAPFTPFHGTYVGFHLRGRVSIKVYELSLLQEREEIKVVDAMASRRMKENLGQKINSPFSEKGVVVSPDGTTLYIARGEHPLNIGTGKKDDIWYSQKDSLGEWDYLQNIGAPLNNAGNNFVVSVAPDGNNLLVANTYLPDGRSLGGGVSTTRRTGTGWERPKNVVIEDYYNNALFVDYCLSPNQKVLLMAVERKDTKGDMDLYCSFLNENQSWSAPQHLGPVVNSFAREFSPFIAPDNQTLYFASYGHPGYGSADIFVSRRLDDSWTNWSEPENLGPEVNTSTWEANYTLDARGDYAYLASAEGSIGLTDIFRIAMSSGGRPRPVVLISGIVLDASTGQPIEAQIRYFSLSQGEEDLGIASSHPVTGRYTIILPAGENYGFHADKSGFYPESANLNTLGVDTYTELKQDLLLSPINVGVSVTLNNLFFDVNQSVLQKESFPELERLVKLLETHPGMEIEIAGHTDNSGASEYNLKLSNERSNAVLAYLSERGFASRANAVGYGATKPKTSNDTEEGRRLNRRVEIMILKL